MNGPVARAGKNEELLVLVKMKNASLTRSLLLLKWLGVELLVTRRDDAQKKIAKDEEELVRLHRRLNELSRALASLNERLATNTANIAAYDQTIAETETAYAEVCDMETIAYIS